MQDQQKERTEKRYLQKDATDRWMFADLHHDLSEYGPLKGEDNTNYCSIAGLFFLNVLLVPDSEIRRF
ncbi:hypothetical protein TNCV_4749971 [Trichonephila clavipes]|nr:hypothetical protein TNCV_4749971 [Trichonephila clavipes]